MSRKSWDERIKQVKDLLIVATDLLTALEMDMKAYSSYRKENSGGVYEGINQRGDGEIRDGNYGTGA